MKLITTENVLKYEYKHTVEVDELDLDIKEKILPEVYNADNYIPTDEIIIDADDHSYGRQSEPLSIQRLIEVVNELTSAGSDYVEIVYHEDHRGYVFTGLKISKASKEEIDANNTEYSKRNNRRNSKRINQLEEELTKLKNETFNEAKISNTTGN